MCSFLVSTTSSVDEQQFKKSLEKIGYRGPDMSRIIKDKGVFGFNRLSIMGLDETGMQPFTDNGSIAVCNGELYAFRKLKKELCDDGVSFISESDCEIILPLFKKYGVEMFKKLDGEFAMVIYDAKSDSFIAVRDPFGIRGMFYG